VYILFNTKTYLRTAVTATVTPPHCRDTRTTLKFTSAGLDNHLVSTAQAQHGLICPDKIICKLGEEVRQLPYNHIKM